MNWNDQKLMDLLEGKMKKHQSVTVAPIHVPSAITASHKALKSKDSILTPLLDKNYQSNKVNQVNLEKSQTPLRG